MEVDVRKVLELICAALPAHEQKQEDDFFPITLSEVNFKRQGLSMDAGVSILKHKISEHYAVIGVGDIYLATPANSNDEELFGQYCINLEAHPAICKNLGTDTDDDEKIRFSFKDGVLEVKDKKIVFGSLDSKEVGCYVLEHLFSHDLKEPSDYIDIHETFFKGEPFKGKRYYDACGVIQKRVAKEVQVVDLFLFNSSDRGFVRINPAYLP
ncbi:MAG: hypothetical protein AMXMBFR44_4460 [Candidatus Campbellbacteria bacterium]